MNYPGTNGRNSPPAREERVSFGQVERRRRLRQRFAVLPPAGTTGVEPAASCRVNVTERISLCRRWERPNPRVAPTSAAQ